MSAPDRPPFGRGTLDAKATAWAYLDAAMRSGNPEDEARVTTMAEIAEVEVQATKAGDGLMVVNSVRGGANIEAGVIQ